uniref:Uncharacterized protein n=1 Tax=Knipowitschia caucasica TaxID=637954 RepID=A0AAV2IXD2_KNICA
MAVVCLLVICAAALASCGPIYVPPNLDQAHKSIVASLNLTLPEVGSRPLFTSVIRSLNSSCQLLKEDVMLMNATLDVYTRVFSILLKTPLSPNNRDLEKLNHAMSRLKSQISHQQQNKEELLAKIRAVKVEDALVQRKVLAEFLEVYHALSGLIHNTCVH